MSYNVTQTQLSAEAAARAAADTKEAAARTVAVNSLDGRLKIIEPEVASLLLRTTALETSMTLALKLLRGYVGAPLPPPLIIPPPPPITNPPPPPTITPTPPWSGPIVVTTNGVTLDGLTITAPYSASGDDGRTGTGIYCSASAAAPIDHLTIKNCIISGFESAIFLYYVTNLIIEDCILTDCDYAGIGIFSGIGGTLQRNTIQRIGYTRTNFGTWKGNNAYGIITDHSTISGNLTLDPLSANILVDSNTIEDVPLWMGLNTHGGQNITFSNNTVRRCPRAIFIASDTGGVNHPHNVYVTGNTLQEAVHKAGGTPDTEGVLIASLNGGSIIGNKISNTFGAPGYQDYGGASTGVAISGNTMTSP